MATDALLFMAATAAIAGIIAGTCAYLGLTRLLRILMILWTLLSVVLLVLAMTSGSFDRQVFLSIWFYFAVPAVAGGGLAAWSVGRMLRRNRS